MLYKKCQSSKTPQINLVKAPSDDHHGEAPSPTGVEDIQYHPKAEFGAIFGSPEQTYKLNAADDVHPNELSNMSSVRLAPPQDYDANVYTN